MKTMSSTLKTLAVATAICLSTVSLMAAEAGTDNATAGAKFTRGVVGLFFGWLELPGQMYDVAVKDGPGMAATVGFAKGLGMMTARYLVSTFELVTFPIPINDYKPLLEQEYPWGYFATEGTIIVPAPTSTSQAPPPKR